MTSAELVDQMAQYSIEPWGDELVVTLLSEILARIMNYTRAADTPLVTGRELLPGGAAVETSQAILDQKIEDLRDHYG